MNHWQLILALEAEGPGGATFQALLDDAAAGDARGVIWNLVATAHGAMTIACRNAGLDPRQVITDMVLRDDDDDDGWSSVIRAPTN